MIIYHIISYTDWQAAQAAGEYRPASLAAEGFIHASTAAQVAATALRYYHGLRGLCLLAIDTEKCLPEVRFERVELPTGPTEFPHIFGALNLSAVTAVIDFPPGPDGAFSLPDAVI